MKNNGLIAFMGIIIMAVMQMYPSVLAISYSDNTYGEVITTPQATIIINETEFNVNNSQYFQGYTPTTLKDWIQGLFNSVYCALTGCTMSGDIDMSGNSISNINTLCNSTDCFTLQELNYTEKSTTYLANNITTIYGTPSGNLTDILYYNQGTYNISEKAGANPLEVRINYTNVTDFNQLIIREYYLGSSSHFIKAQIYDYDSATWEDYFEFVGQDGFSILTVPVYDSQEHIDNGLVQVRLQHQGTGIASHKLYIDFTWLQQGQIIGGSTNLDGYAKYNFGTNNFNGFGNFTTTGNITANYNEIKFNGVVPSSTCQRLYDNGTALIYNYTRC